MPRAIPDIDGLKFSFWSKANDEPVHVHVYLILNKLYNLEASGSRTPVSSCYVQRRPRMLYQSRFRGESILMNKRGRRRMLLVLLLPWQAFGNIRNRSIGPLVSVIRTVGSAGSRRKRQTIRRRSRLLKSSNGRRGPSGHLSKSKMFWTGYTKRFPANALFEQHLENI